MIVGLLLDIWVIRPTRWVGSGTSCFEISFASPYTIVKKYPWFKGPIVQWGRCYRSYVTHLNKFYDS